MIFAPDLMALLIDRLGTFDVEIVDDTLFVYGGRFDLLAPRTYDWLQEIVDTVVARTVRRTERYSDDLALLQSDPRAARPTGPTNVIAEPGRRLRARRWGWASVVALLLVAFWIYDAVVAPLFGLPTLDH